MEVLTWRNVHALLISAELFTMGGGSALPTISDGVATGTLSVMGAVPRSLSGCGQRSTRQTVGAGYGQAHYSEMGTERFTIPMRAVQLLLTASLMN